MSIPLVQEATKDAINTSIIAIKRNIERINMLLGLSNSEEIDTSEFVKKSDIVDVVEAGNMNPVTSNAVVPVDEVTSGNMQSVTSNAVAEALPIAKSGTSPVISTPSSGGTSTTAITFDTPFEDVNYVVFLEIYSSSYGHITAFVKSESKTTNGFTIQSFCTQGGYTYRFNWYAYRFKTQS